jgi:hypothetical protein
MFLVVGIFDPRAKESVEIHERHLQEEEKKERRKEGKKERRREGEKKISSRQKWLRVSPTP